MVERQRRIDFEHANVNQLIDEATFPSTTKAPSTVKAMLRAIAFATRHAPRVPMEQMASRVGVSRKTAQRAIREAQLLGVLLVKTISDYGGQRPNAYAIDLRRLAQYGASRESSEPFEIDQAPGQTDRAPLVKLTGGPGQTDRANKEPDLNQDLEPNERERAAPPATCPPELLDWSRWWNGLHQRGLVLAGANAERPSSVLLKNYRRSLGERELRELLADREAIEAAIVESDFVRDKGWFTLAALFRKGSSGEWIVEQLLRRVYCDRRGRTGRTERAVVAQTYDPTRQIEF